MIKRVKDIIQRYYPSMISQELIDIQPLSKNTGELFKINIHYDYDSSIEITYQRNKNKDSSK